MTAWATLLTFLVAGLALAYGFENGDRFGIIGVVLFITIVAIGITWQLGV